MRAGKETIVRTAPAIPIKVVAGDASKMRGRDAVQRGEFTGRGQP